jgi:5-methylcytosine-specific restriction enzyme A
MAWGSESRQARGYDAAWQKRRLQILKRDRYLCQCDDCKLRRVPLPATEVNHKVPKAKAKRMGWTREQMDHPSNLESLNSDCHQRITIMQNGGRPRRKIGLDGFPIAPKRTPS